MKVEKNITELYELHAKTWYENEKRKQAAKRAYRDKLYPTNEDIYGKKEGDECG